MKSNRTIYTKKTQPISYNLEFQKPLEFGKHKGKTPEQIIEMGDNQYLSWLFYNNINIKFCENLKIKFK